MKILSLVVASLFFIPSANAKSTGWNKAKISLSVNYLHLESSGSTNAEACVTVYFDLMDKSSSKGFEISYSGNREYCFDLKYMADASDEYLYFSGTHQDYAIVPSTNFHDATKVRFTGYKVAIYESDNESYSKPSPLISLDGKSEDSVQINISAQRRFIGDELIIK